MSRSGDTLRHMHSMVPIYAAVIVGIVVPILLVLLLLWQM
jgi:hypothetical protein